MLKIAQNNNVIQSKKRGGASTPVLGKNRWRSVMLDPMGHRQILINNDDFRGANKNLRRQKKELSAHGERQGPARGEILTELIWVMAATKGLHRNAPP